MEHKHFSHNHGLIFHQLPQGSEIHCSGCKSSGSGNIYACWQCNHFLHEQCYHAARSIKHPTHALHPLTLVPYPTYPSGSFYCNSCNLFGNGLSYTCSECHFDMHVGCALMHSSNSHLSPFPVDSPHNYNHQPQTAIYPPIQNNNFPTYPPQNDPQYFGQSQNNIYPPSQNESYPPVSAPYPNPSPLIGSGGSINLNTPFSYNSPQPNALPNYNPPASAPPYSNSTPTYSTVVNSTPTTSQPPASYPKIDQSPQTNNPQQKPPKIIKHFSHPHILKDMEVDQKLGKVCSACECRLSGTGYLCTEPHCPFGLHKSCFDSPLEVKHKCHLSHPLKLLTSPAYTDGFTCNACLKDGKAFAYNCATCSYDLHIDCITWPDAVNRPDHEHDLILYYSSPAAQTTQEVTFVCDVCKNPVHDLAWIYFCRECDFGTHLECVATAVKEEGASTGAGGGKTEEELMREMELKLAMLHILIGGNAALGAV